MIIDTHLQTLLAELQEWGQSHDQRQEDWNKKMLNLGPDSAQLISMLIRSSRRTRVLEIGTSNGYSTIWLAWSVQATGGRVISVDHDSAKLAMADENLCRAGLRELVELRHSDSTQALRTLAGPFDLVFFDPVPTAAATQLDLLVPKLADDAFVLADNAISHPETMAKYQSILTERLTCDHVVVPVGKGLSVAYRSADQLEAPRC